MSIADDFRCRQDWGPDGYRFEVVQDPSKIAYWAKDGIYGGRWTSREAGKAAMLGYAYGKAIPEDQARDLVLKFREAYNPRRYAKTSPSPSWGKADYEALEHRVLAQLKRTSEMEAEYRRRLAAEGFDFGEGALNDSLEVHSQEEAERVGIIFDELCEEEMP